MKKQILLVSLLIIAQLSNSLNAQWIQTSLVNTKVISFAAQGTNLFAGTELGDIYLSTDLGNTWSLADNGLTGDSVRAIAISGNCIFAGTTYGVFLSTNNGGSWTSVNSGIPGGSRALAIQGANIFSGGTNGVLLSADTGSTWTPVNNGLPVSPVHSLAVNGTKIFVGTEEGIFTSTDTGKTWVASFTVHGPVWDGMAISGSNIFAASYMGGGVRFSSDSGATWTNLNTGSTENFSVVANGANVFLGASNGVFASVDNGISWTAQNTGFTNYQSNAVIVVGSTVFSGMNDGVWKRGMGQVTGAYDFSVDPNDGCSPLSLTINNLTTDTNAYLYQWTFIGPPSEDTLVIWDTLTASFTQTFTFNGADTGNGIIYIYLSVYDSSGNFLGNSITNHEVDIHASFINSYTISDTCGTTSGEATVSGCCGNQPYSYLWFDGSTSPTVTGLVSGTYGITMTDAWGCTVEDSVIIGTATFLPPSICIVSVDTTLKKNTIVWEEQSPDIISYNIYKETTTAGVYNLIGTNPALAVSVFTDTASNPAQIAARYKISNMDSCGNESALSTAHKTIHLVISLGIPPAINLSWDNYEGISFSKYYIWRGNALGSLSMIDSAQSSLNSYTDLNPPAGTNFYAVQVVHMQGCNPTLKSPAAYSSSFSNVADLSGLVGLNEHKTTLVSLLPNPTNGKITISGINITSADVYNLIGEKINSIPGAEIDLSSHPNGIYFITVTSGNSVSHHRIVKH